jgi:acyl-CoA synthetase (AMP-forming)/AMP-acid ligase II
VVGVADDRWGEQRVAIVVLLPRATLEPSELERHCRAHLAPFKVPRQLVIREVLPPQHLGQGA